MDLGLEGKVALVTGGSDGIGKAAAHRLATEGARVTICARRPDVLEQAAADIRASTGGEVAAIPADVTKPDQIAGLFDAILAAHGRIDILVNNAGTSAAGLFEDVTDEVWQADLDLKLFGAIRCSRLAIPHMRAHGGGRIVNITTPAGKAPAPASVPTSVSRAAGIALTKELSKDYAGDNILVNTVCIGLIRSGQEQAGVAARPGGPPGPHRGPVLRGAGAEHPAGQGGRGRRGRRPHRLPSSLSEKHGWRVFGGMMGPV